MKYIRRDNNRQVNRGCQNLSDTHQESLKANIFKHCSRTLEEHKEAISDDIFGIPHDIMKNVTVIMHDKFLIHLGIMTFNLDDNNLKTKFKTILNNCSTKGKTGVSILNGSPCFLYKLTNLHDTKVYNYLRIHVDTFLSYFIQVKIRRYDGQMIKSVETSIYIYYTHYWSLNGVYTSCFCLYLIYVRTCDMKQQPTNSEKYMVRYQT
ncbi:hypothetical protein AGLY_012597 [Aphis glycines]|uniref:Uncharacterized protein n=1 Tax=Aphis glycines TaxID=307491 RepID=A0A6G0TA49_APHGL|nr:hypothetical protein AGLY_012597 [Aphis glycines]